MSGTKPLIYLDSCIWIGMLTAETRREQSDTAALAGLVKELDSKQIVAVVSTLARVEILEADLSIQQIEVLKKLMQKKSVVQIKDVTVDIIDLAHEIRSFYKDIKNKDNKERKTLSVPDSIHLATAIYYECDSFYTLDEKNKPDGCGLLKLVPPIANKYTINLSKPNVTQLGLNV